MLCDWYSYRVPNELILLGYLLGLMYQIQQNDFTGVVVFLVRAILPILLFYLLFLLGALGAGDLKLLSVISVFIEISSMIELICAAFVIEAGVAYLKIIRGRQLQIRIESIKKYLINCFQSKKILQYSTFNQKESYLHFTIGIYAGYMLMLTKNGDLLS